MFVQYHTIKSIHGWPWYAVWLVLLGFGGGMIVPAICDGRSMAKWGRQTFNAIYLAQTSCCCGCGTRWICSGI